MISKKGRCYLLLPKGADLGPANDGPEPAWQQRARRAVHGQEAVDAISQSNMDGQQRPVQSNERTTEKSKRIAQKP